MATAPDFADAASELEDEVDDAKAIDPIDVPPRDKWRDFREARPKIVRSTTTPIFQDGKAPALRKMATAPDFAAKAESELEAEVDDATKWLATKMSDAEVDDDKLLYTDDGKLRGINFYKRSKGRNLNREDDFDREQEKIKYQKIARDHLTERRGLFLDAFVKLVPKTESYRLKREAEIRRANEGSVQLEKLKLKSASPDADLVNELLGDEYTIVRKEHLPSRVVQFKIKNDKGGLGLETNWAEFQSMPPAPPAATAPPAALALPAAPAAASAPAKMIADALSSKIKLVDPVVSESTTKSLAIKTAKASAFVGVTYYLMFHLLPKLGILKKKR